jgi:hypothetical protein
MAVRVSSRSCCRTELGDLQFSYQAKGRRLGSKIFDIRRATVSGIQDSA